jgi:hypothetical protein
MAKWGKQPDTKTNIKKEGRLWCERECSNCEIGAHERCNSPKCHMPKWRDVKSKLTKKRR